MLFADTPAGPQFVLLALLGLTTALLLWRGHRRRMQIAGRDVAGEVRREFHDAARAGTSEIHRMESRLYDFGREVEGRVETTLATLDRLIEDAEDEIIRLELLLERSRQAPVDRATLRLPDAIGPGQRPLSPEQRRMIAHLAAAGYVVDEIARLVDRSPGEIARALGDENSEPHADAA
ncbi:MAG TPA: helix-turn-helix domain-containing protein [Planctomycetaceae bacterium]|nr:helix-turn-helix domain-containing protein [Planctomycetaceae bacterium]